MIESPRKKSPRAPSLALDDALIRVMKIYERERLHPAPSEIVAQHMGYKSANNGSALSTLASLRYFGLLQRPKEGLFAVAKEVEAYKFAPDEKMKRSLLLGFLKRPALYHDLLEKYATGLPSDANLKFELIQHGFAPLAADAAVVVFKKSLLFADYYEEMKSVVDEDVIRGSEEILTQEVEQQSHNSNKSPAPLMPAVSSIVSNSKEPEEVELDRIPVRLTGGRRAWLSIPTPFYNADRDRLKAQIDLLLTKEDEEGAS